MASALSTLRLMSHPENFVLTDVEAAARVRLQEAAAQLEALQRQLKEIHDSLPVSSREDLMLLGEEDMDVATETRSVIECVLNDSIQPAIRDLKSVAAYRPSQPGKKRG
jgi:hypothetical protein